MRVGNDPLEQMIAVALDNAGIKYFTDYEGKSPANLDFFLPDLDIYLEIKSGHSKRISKQMTRHQNIIAIQGQKSVGFVVDMLKKTVKVSL